MQEIELETVHFREPVREPRKNGQYGQETQYFGQGALPGSNDQVRIFLRQSPVGVLCVLRAKDGTENEIPWHIVKTFRRMPVKPDAAEPKKAEKPAA